MFHGIFILGESWENVIWSLFGVEFSGGSGNFALSGMRVPRFTQHYKSPHLTIVIWTSLVNTQTHTDRHTDRETDKFRTVISWAKICDRAQKKPPRHLTKNFDETNQSPDLAERRGGRRVFHAIIPCFDVQMTVASHVSGPTPPPTVRQNKWKQRAGC